MAHVVGVPKRDPCSKCLLPVFLAERLTVGKNVYHRTCLKCARCNSQLTPGSFYETEIDDEYCCETCPDEEKSINLPSTSTISISASLNDTKSDLKNNDDSGVGGDGGSIIVEKTNSISKNSIADRLAFFENDGKKLLQKSLSDEEKSQSLKKISQNVYKHNSALSSFMNSHFTDETDSTSEQSRNISRRNSNSHENSENITSNSNTDIDDDDDDVDDVEENDLSNIEKPPELPKSQPPSLATSYNISEIDSSINIYQTSEPSSFEHSNVNINNDNKSTSLIKLNEIHDSNEQIHIDNIKTISNDITSITKSSEIHNNDQNISNLNVTKDNSPNDEKMRTNDLIIIDNNNIINNKSANENSTMTATNSSSSMVRARLHQFEIISNNTTDNNISNNDINISNNSKIDNNLISKSINLHDKNEINSESIENLEINKEVPKIVSNQDHNDNNNHNIKNNLIDNSNNETKNDNAEELENNASCPNDEKIILNEIVQIEKNIDEQSNIDNQSTIIIENIEQDIKLTEQNAQTQFEITEENSNLSKSNDYPEDLNPFQSDEEDNIEDVNYTKASTMSLADKRKSLNPFDSSDDEQEDNQKIETKLKPPPKKISTNPFGSESEDESLPITSSSTPKKMPIPTPRINTSSQNSTPEPTPRLARQHHDRSLKNSGDYYGSNASLTTPNSGSGFKLPIENFNRDIDVRSSTNSIASSSGSVSGGSRNRKGRKAPPPPIPATVTSIQEHSMEIKKELFPASIEIDSKKSTPSSSRSVTPLPRKKRPAPAPPSVDSKPVLIIPSEISNSKELITEIDIQSEEHIEKSKLSDEDKSRLEQNTKDIESHENIEDTSLSSLISQTGPTKRRLIALDASLLEDSNLSLKEEENVVYRRTIATLPIDNPSTYNDDYKEENVSHDRQLEKLKDNKEAQNRNRQSQISLSSPTDENDPLYNKSVHGKWKRRKGPAPALPVPPKKVLQMLPLQEIRHELEIIEVQQQGLEKQGVMLEKMIRERCEGTSNKDDDGHEDNSNSTGVNSKEVEDLILQLFELVNEKNELFRRQAELMYLRRQHRLEQEQADLEYEIRVLMAQPERNKTDSDKAREESLIGRLVEVVQLRNEVIDCLEMDRLREAEEDLSIKQRLEMHTAKRDEELCKQTPTKLSKKEKKKQKESKKLGKSKKLDADKDADESELNVENQKLKKKKKKFLF